MAEILNGNLVAKLIKNKIKLEVLKLKKQTQKTPHLAAILIGKKEESVVYVNNKIKDCEEVGFKSSFINLKEDISEYELLKVINKLNIEKNLDGYIIQLPLPRQINYQNIIMEIHPDKDLDCFHPQNFGKMALEMNTFLPATPGGILLLLKYYKILIEKKHCVILGRSNIVGKPMSILMSRKNKLGNCTVTIIHSKSSNIEFYTKQADIIISAIGIPCFLKASMIKNDAIIIDVGITQIQDKNYKKGYYFVGDVDFKEVKNKASYITPVPGGVGPMTRVMLLKNTLLSFKKKIEYIL